MKSGVICYLCSDPIWFLEGLLFVRKLYLSQNNPCQLALVHIDSPYEPSVRDAMARLLDTPFPTDSIEHRFGIGFGDFILKFGSTRTKSRTLHGDRRPVPTKSHANFAAVELPNKAISQLLAITDGRAPPIIGDEEFPLDLDWHSG